EPEGLGGGPRQSAEQNEDGHACEAAGHFIETDQHRVLLFDLPGIEYDEYTSQQRRGQPGYDALDIMRLEMKDEHDAGNDQDSGQDIQPGDPLPVQDRLQDTGKQGLGRQADQRDGNGRGFDGMIETYPVPGHQQPDPQQTQQLSRGRHRQLPLKEQEYAEGNTGEKNPVPH